VYVICQKPRAVHWQLADIYIIYVVIYIGLDELGGMHMRCTPELRRASQRLVHPRGTSGPAVADTPCALVITN